MYVDIHKRRFDWSPDTRSGTCEAQRKSGQRSLRTTEYSRHSLKKKITWTKSGRESAKREAELFDMLEKAATNEKRGRDRDKLGDKPEVFLTRKEEEDEATGLMEKMRKNVVAAQQKNFEAEQSLCNALRRYVDNNGRDQDQARTLMTKCWQSMQSRGSKNMNLEKDLEDTLHSPESGWE